MSTPSHKKFEREFFSLAKWMLGCNLRAMGGIVEGTQIPCGPLDWSLLGTMDHAIEMRLLCREYRDGRR